MRVHRAKKAPAPRSGLHPDLTLDQILVIAADGLDATFADQGLPDVADWTTRLLSALVILNAIKASEWRKSPEQARRALERALPARVTESPEAIRRLQVQQMYRGARREWDKLRTRVSPDLTKLVVEPYPRFLVGPGERYDDVLKEAPDPIPLEERPLTRLSDGAYLLERPGEPPLVLEVEEASARVG